MLGRLPCCSKFCCGYGGPGYFYLSEQWLGYQHPCHRPVSKYFPLFCFVISRSYTYKIKIFACLCSLFYHVGDGIVVKGRGYGVRSIRVDGNDALAMYNVVHAARKMAVTEHRPILVEVKLDQSFSVTKHKHFISMRTISHFECLTGPDISSRTPFHIGRFL